MAVKKNVINLNNPRQNALQAMKQSVSQYTWQSNKDFTLELRSDIKMHQLNRHSVVRELSQGYFDVDQLQIVHLEYRHAIVQIFTDALTMALAQSRQLEPRLPPGSRIAPRFLLTLNILDEFGFQPGLDAKNYYRGNPVEAHYPLFETLLNQMNVSQQQREQFKPSHEASALRTFLESSFLNYETILLLLAIAEEQVILFTPALRRATEISGLDIQTGYYSVHGTSDEECSNAADDDHEEDLWNTLNQACLPFNYNSLRTDAFRYLDLWNDFWNKQSSLLKSNNHMHTPKVAVAHKPR